MLGAVATAGVVWLLAWGAARALVVSERLPRADVLLVLAGAPVYAERIAHAAALYHEGRAARVLLTNDGSPQSWSRTLQRNPLSVERAVLRLERAGVPSSRIEVLPGRVESTYDEAIAARRYADEHRIAAIIVVTSMYHTRRAQWTLHRAFRGAGTRVGIEPAAPTATPPAQSWLWHTSAWPMVAGEYVKFAYYWLRYA